MGKRRKRDERQRRPHDERPPHKMTPSPTIVAVGDDDETSDAVSADEDAPDDDEEDKGRGLPRGPSPPRQERGGETEPPPRDRERGGATKRRSPTATNMMSGPALGMDRHDSAPTTPSLRGCVECDLGVGNWGAGPTVGLGRPSFHA